MYSRYYFILVDFTEKFIVSGYCTKNEIVVRPTRKTVHRPTLVFFFRTLRAAMLAWRVSKGSNANVVVVPHLLLLVSSSFKSTMKGLEVSFT